VRERGRVWSLNSCASKRRDESSAAEMLAMLFLLLFAGHGTMTHLISGSVYELLKDPGLRDWLSEDSTRTNLAVEEFLRFISPVQFGKPRLVRKDVERGGNPAEERREDHADARGCKSGSASKRQSR
jgi:cytochrome P450